MIIEQLSLLFTSYFYATLILMPLLVIYWLVDYRKMSLRSILTFHKILLLATICLPIVIYINSTINITAVTNESLSIKPVETTAYSNRSTENISPSVQSSVQSSIQSSTVSTGSNLQATALINKKPLTTDHYLLAAHDIVYYFSGLLITLSFLGLTLFIYRYVLQYCHLLSIKKSGKKYITENNVYLIRSPEINTCFSTGLITKKIFLPNNINHEKEKIIIEHELTHLACRHHLWSFVETVMSYLFWYNPFSHLLKKRGAFYREIECDSISIQTMDKFNYSRALVESAEAILVDKKHRLLCQNWVDKNNLQRRVNFILGEQRSKRRTYTLAALFSGISLSLTLSLTIGNINDEFLEAEILNTIQQDHKKLVSVREKIEIDQVPLHFIQALLTHEDEDFYQHNGLSYSGTARAISINIRSFLSGESPYIQGGSTITQQLAKSFLSDKEKNLSRKARELKVARVLEKNFSKDQILEMYLTRVFFGNRAWGLAQAAITYFDKPYSQLSRTESAMLVPFLEAPVKYNLIDNPAVAQQRQHLLLKEMDKTPINI